MRPASLAVLAALIAALEVACRTGMIARTVLIAPSEMAASLWDILRSGEYAHAILRTFADVAAAACIAIGGGFLAGVALHQVPALRRGMEPYLASYYAVPTFIFYPVLVVLLGVGSAPIIAIAALLAVVAMVAATLNGLDRIPRVLYRTARAMRLSPLARTVLVVLPAAAPALFTGARLAVAYAFIGVIASEFILSGDGLGYAIAYAYNNFDNRTMYGLMLLIVVAVSLVNGALDTADRRLQARLGR